VGIVVSRRNARATSLCLLKRYGHGTGGCLDIVNVLGTQGWQNPSSLDH
jgi:hypothetical protein